ncbi:MAG TPA: hypothetical protein VF177_12050 [Anaerolineae bacterium]
MTEESVYKAEEAGKLSARSSLPAVLVIGIGLVLLAANLFGFHLIEVLWPGFVIAPGLALLWPAHSSTANRQSKLSFLAVPGAILVTIGLLLFAMNITDRFEAWAYSWTLLVAAVAGGLMYVKRFDKSSTIHERGRRLIRAMILLFMVLAVFFEIVVFDNFNPLLPLALIGYGVYLLLRNRQVVH